VALDERGFFNNRNEIRDNTLACMACGRTIRRSLAALDGLQSNPVT
jgi:hypothetical protein